MISIEREKRICPINGSAVASARNGVGVESTISRTMAHRENRTTRRRQQEITPTMAKRVTIAPSESSSSGVLRVTIPGTNSCSS